MAGFKDNREFKEAVIQGELLDEAIDWIKKHMPVGDVYDEAQLKEWAEENGYVKET